MEHRGIFDRLASPWSRWGFAIAAVLVATAIDVAYQVAVKGIDLFTPYFPFLVAVALLSGRNPAFTSLFAANLVVATLWMEPIGLPWATHASDQWALFGYLIAGGLMILITLKMQAQSELAERRRAELRTMLDLIPVGVGIAQDSAADKITLNPYFANLLGIAVAQNASLSGPAADEVPFRAVRDGREIPAAELPMQVAARTGREVRDIDLDLVFEDGRTFEIRVSAAPLFDEHGRVRGAIGAHVDLTDLRQASRALATASRQKDEFLATLAHELRNPLAPIRYASALLRADQAPETIERARTTIERQAAHMTRLLDDLLDLSRITRTAISLHQQVLDLRHLVSEAVDATHPALAERGHRVVLSFPDEPAWIVGDRERMHQVIVNLLSNAAKYTPPRGNVSVAVRSEGTNVLLAVQDDGIGLTAAMASKVFDLFTQVHEGVGDVESGLGIGLSVVQRLVGMHGGDVAVQSEGLGKGSTFSVRLPAAPRPMVPRPASHARAPIAFASKPRVLVVDDNRDAADTLAAFLRISDLNVHVAYDGSAATQVLEKARPDVVLLDIGMPHVDGFAVAAWIRSKPWGRAVRLVALTGWGQPEDRKRTVAAGFDLHLTKPVDPEQLLDKLHTMFATGSTNGA